MGVVRAEVELMDDETGGRRPAEVLAADEPVHLVPLAEKPLDEVATVLAGGPRDERDAHCLARSSARSFSTIIPTSSSKWTVGCQPRRSRALEASPTSSVDLGGPHVAGVLARRSRTSR